MIDKREITPKLLADIIVLLFSKVSDKEVLEDKIQYNSVTAEYIASIMIQDSHFVRTHSLENCIALAHSVIHYVSQKTAWQTGRQPEHHNHLNLFDLLSLTLQDLLVMNQNQMTCKYEEIDSWRLVVRYLGEELMLSLRYAQWDYEHHKPMRNRYDEYAWPYVTAHNNKQLHDILHQGVSEHHCHLWGSTPYFHVSWINLMNDVTNSEYQRNLRKFENKSLLVETKRNRPHGGNSTPVEQYHWEAMQVRAAWIRLYLCKRLCDNANMADEYRALKTVCCFDDWRKLLLYRGKLQAEMNSYSHLSDNSGDYILSYAKLRGAPFAQNYQPLIGERWLYYQLFRDYCKPIQQRKLTPKDYNLFFAYFLIRTKTRNRMVQNNDYIGFDNFQHIQSHKTNFLGDLRSMQSAARLAINEALRKTYIKELEVRISPDPEQVKLLDSTVNARYYADCNKYISRAPLSSKNGLAASANLDLRERYYFVFHFLKRQDPMRVDSSAQRSMITGRICRDAKQRKFYMAQAKKIIRFREDHPEHAKRVLGIDAASREIGCRPEVFGTVYRLLGNHQFSYGGYMEKRQQLPPLGKTYHVGEDFPDIVNGLRAIDEVIRFLDFDCGDRLGHALVLGINVEDWYEQKQRVVFVSVQEHLDDLAWLYHAITHFSIPNVDTLKERLIRDFEYWFRIVYRNSIKDEHLKNIMECARKNWYDISHEDHDRYHVHTCHFDIMDYYRAWMLRGDDPSCYVDGYFKKPFGSSLMLSEENAKVCTNFPPHYEDRYIPEYSLLNYLYQYDMNVQYEGNRKIKVDISDEYIRAVKSVQREMRYHIAQKGIAIETNPTSNVLIGAFREYDKHPILSFFNRNLPVTNEEEQDCAQLQVSINTDDSGVFYTDLETEYALLAHSVEQITDENGRYRFKKNDIYSWLNAIRIMGNNQTFRITEDEQ